MTTRQSLVGQIRKPGAKPENVELVLNQRPVITPAEQAAGIKWVDGRYPEGHVLRYGTNTTPGTTDMTTAIQNLATVCSTGKVMGYAPPGQTLLVSDTIEFTGSPWVVFESPIKQQNSTDLTEVVSLNLTGSDPANVRLIVDGNDTNNTTAAGVLIKTCRKHRAHLDLTVKDCTSGVKIQGNTEFVKIDVYAEDCDVACHVTNDGVTTPDELQINILAHNCGTFFKADGTAKSSGDIRIVGESCSSNPIDIAQGWWRIGGEIRGCDAGVLFNAGLSAHVDFDLYLIGSDTADAYAMEVDTNFTISGRVMLSNWDKGVWIKDVGTGSTLEVHCISAIENGETLRLGDAANSKFCDNFTLTAGRLSANNGTTLNLDNCRRCEIRPTSLVGTTVISTTSLDNVIRLPRGNYDVTITNNRTQGDNTIVLSGNYTLTELNALSAFEGYVAERVQGSTTGGAFYHQGFDTWIPDQESEASGTAIASASAGINTTNKYKSKLVWDTTNTRLMRASGSGATDAWIVVDGSATVTPS